MGKELEPITLPKGYPSLVLLKDKYVALDDTLFGECRQAPLNEGGADASAAIALVDRQMVEIPPSTIVAAEDRADQLVAAARTWLSAGLRLRNR